MKAIAFETKIQQGIIKIPLNYQQELNESQTVKIVILSEDTSNINTEEFDPITALVGSLSAEVNDIGENHDIYLGANLVDSEVLFMKKHGNY